MILVCGSNSKKGVNWVTEVIGVKGVNWVNGVIWVYGFNWEDRVNVVNVVGLGEFNEWDKLGKRGEFGIK